MLEGSGPVALFIPTFECVCVCGSPPFVLPHKQEVQEDARKRSTISSDEEFYCFFSRCAEGYWGEEDSGSPSLDKPIKSEDGECGGESSTEKCCGRFGPVRKERRAACLEDFKCTSDPCKVWTYLASKTCFIFSATPEIGPFDSISSSTPNSSGWNSSP